MRVFYHFVAVNVCGQGGNMSIPVQVTGQKCSDEELFLDLRIPANLLPDFMQQAYDAIAETNNVSAPQGGSLEKALADALTPQVLSQLVVNTVMNMAAPFGRSSVEGILTVGSPRFVAHGNLEEGKPFTFTASWALLPRAELSSYDPVEITAPAETVTDEMVGERIESLLEQASEFVAIEDDSPVKRGDAVELSLTTSLDGKKIEGLCFDARAYSTGQGNMPEGFEANIIGMKPGETKSFSFEGISDIDDDGEPKTSTYLSEATVLRKLRRQRPELTDAWVQKNVVGCDSVSAFKDAIREELEKSAGPERRHYLNYLAAQELAKRFQGHIPDAAYEAVRGQLQSEMDSRAKQAGLSTDDFLQQQGMNEQQFGVRMILEAHDRLAQSIAIDALARHLGFSVSEEDLVEFYRVQAPDGHADEYRRRIEGSGHEYLAREGALRLKTSDYLREHAIIHEGSPYSS